MLTLDEAIKHCEEKAKELRKDYERAVALNIPSEGCLECANEHEQLAEWLKDYKRLLDARPKGEWVYINKEDKEKGYGGYCSVCKCDMPIGINDWKQEYYESKFCPDCGADMRNIEDKNRDPVISAIQENNAKYDERPNIDFSRISYDLGESNEPNCVTCDHFGKCEGCEKREEE